MWSVRYGNNDDVAEIELEWKGLNFIICFHLFDGMGWLYEPSFAAQKTLKERMLVKQKLCESRE